MTAEFLMSSVNYGGRRSPLQKQYYTPYSKFCWFPVAAFRPSFL
jgi:hypothetical protein